MYIIQHKEKMKINLIHIIFFSFIAYEAKSQIDTNQTAQNVLYIEGIGIGGYGSLNYERTILLKSNLRMGLRIGLSTYNITDYTRKFNPDIIIPIAINGLYGNKHKIEFGFGQTISNIVKANFSDLKPGRVTNLHANFTIGYRYQKDTGGVIFRISYTPLIEFYESFRHWGGISIGYAF